MIRTDDVALIQRAMRNLPDRFRELRIRDVRVFQDGAVYVLTDGAAGRLLKLTPK